MWLLLLFTYLNPQIPISERQLVKKIDILLDHPSMVDSFWGVMVYAPIRGKVLYQRFADKNFRPASNQKILTTLLGFEYLGAEYQFQTLIYHSGDWNPSTGILDGDLIIEGRGDPSLSGNYAGEGMPTEALIGPLLKHLANRGLREIRGDVVGVIGYFDSVQIQKSWEWDDLGSSYATPVTPLSLHDGWIEIEMWTDIQGQPYFSYYPPWTSGVELHFKTEASGSKMALDIQREWGSNRLKIQGQFPPCSTRTLIISAWNPNRHFLETFTGLLQKHQIRVLGELRLVQFLPEEKLAFIDSIDSPPLASLSKTLMQASQNHYADCLLKTVAKEVTGEGSFEAGAEIAEQFLHQVMDQLGAPHSSNLGIHIRDGSGLSAQNYLRPSYLVHLLRFGLQQAYGSSWLATFPVLGKAGTLARRGLNNSPSLGRVWAKTGYIYRTRTLSGYALTLAGEPLIFSIMANNYSAFTAEVNRTQDHICDLLVRLKPNRKVRRQKQDHPFANRLPRPSD